MVKAIYLYKCATEAQGELNLRAVQFASWKACGRGQEWFWMLVFVSAKPVKIGKGDRGRTGKRTGAAATSKQQISDWYASDKGEPVMQRSAVKSWVANCERGQQPAATRSSPLPALSHAVITWRRGVKCKDRDRHRHRGLPHTPPARPLHVCAGAGPASPTAQVRLGTHSWMRNERFF